VGVFDAFASPLMERYVVTDATVFRPSQPEIFSDPLTEMLRNGARVPLPRAIEAEVAALHGQHAEKPKAVSGWRATDIRPRAPFMTGAVPSPVYCRCIVIISAVIIGLVRGKSCVGCERSCGGKNSSRQRGSARLRPCGHGRFQHSGCGGGHNSRKIPIEQTRRDRQIMAATSRADAAVIAACR